VTDVLAHAATGECLAEHVEWARTPYARARGLMGRETFPSGHALIIERANQVHTFFVRWPIDVIFCDRDWKVLRATTMPPWRIGRWVRGARYVIELPAGRSSVHVGDRLVIGPDSDSHARNR
jgi:uncharacterized membrane protein (UPF0127 family)